ncbi:MAG: hypothetical protein ACREQV_10130 [Candidatus Binatia bacterium]
MRKKRETAAFLAHLIVVFVPATLLADNAFPEIPAIISSAVPGAGPIWISAEKAIAPDGTLRSEVLGTENVAHFERHLQRQRERQSASANELDQQECAIFFGRKLEHYKDNRSTRALTQNAVGIIEGTITRIESGFLAGTPGSLLLVKVQERLKHSAAISDSEYLYIFFPYARIQTKDGLICANPVGTSMRPAVGDVVLAFPMVRALDADNRLLQIEPRRELALEKPNGKAVLPDAFEGHHISSIGEAETRIRALLNSSREAAPEVH